MGPLELAMAGSGIFGGVGDAIDSGASAGQEKAIGQMRTKELVAGTLVSIVGVVLAFQEKSIWPIVVAVGVVTLMVALHEYHASKNMPQPDLSLIMGGNLK